MGLFGFLGKSKKKEVKETSENLEKPKIKPNQISEKERNNEVEKMQAYIEKLKMEKAKYSIEYKALGKKFMLCNKENNKAEAARLMKELALGKKKIAGWNKNIEMTENSIYKLSNAKENSEFVEIMEAANKATAQYVGEGQRERFSRIREDFANNQEGLQEMDMMMDEFYQQTVTINDYELEDLEKELLEEFAEKPSAEDSAENLRNQFLEEFGEPSKEKSAEDDISDLQKELMAEFAEFEEPTASNEEKRPQLA